MSVSSRFVRGDLGYRQVAVEVEDGMFSAKSCDVLASGLQQKIFSEEKFLGHSSGVGRSGGGGSRSVVNEQDPLLFRVHAEGVRRSNSWLKKRTGKPRWGFVMP
jgi:hypothetical protein